MGRVLTNNTAFAVAREATLGVLPGSPIWKTLEPNGIPNFGSDVTKVAREPISKDRQRRKGTTTDLDSGVELEHDTTMEVLYDFIEGFCFAAFNGPIKWSAIDTDQVTAVVSTGYTVSANGDEPDGTLIYARGFDIAGNNGLKVTAGTSTGTEVKAAGLAAEASPPTNVTLDVCGVRGASGDIEIDASGDIISTVLDFTTLDLTAGQFLFVGGTEDVNRFATDVSGGGTPNRGMVRIVSIATNKIVTDKRGVTFSVDNGAAKLIDLYFGKFGRNVTVDDADFLELSFQFEAEFPNLETPGPGDEYEYAKGNFCNTLGFNFPLTNKADFTAAFTGTDTEPPSTTRATNADTPIAPEQTVAFNTTPDIIRLRVTQTDESGLTTDFKDAKVTFNNNVGPEKVIGTLGAKFMNYGNFFIDIESQIVFTDSDVVAAIRNNTTVTMDFGVRNDDGGFMVDVPSMTMGGGGRDYPINESVLLNFTAEAFQDPTLGTSVGFSMFAVIPAAAP